MAVGNPPRLVMPSGEQVNTFIASQKNTMYNLDLTFSRPWIIKSRYDITALAGFRLSDFSVKVRQDGNTSIPILSNNNLRTQFGIIIFETLGLELFWVSKHKLQ